MRWPAQLISLSETSEHLLAPVLAAQFSNSKGQFITSIMQRFGLALNLVRSKRPSSYICGVVLLDSDSYHVIDS